MISASGSSDVYHSPPTEGITTTRCPPRRTHSTIARGRSTPSSAGFASVHTSVPNGARPSQRSGRSCGISPPITSMDSFAVETTPERRFTVARSYWSSATVPRPITPSSLCQGSATEDTGIGDASIWDPTPRSVSSWIDTVYRLPGVIDRGIHPWSHRPG